MLDGVYDQARLPGAFDAARYVEDNRTITGVRLLRRRAGSAGSTVINVTKNGASVFAVLGDQPVVPAGAGSYASDLKAPTAPGAAACVPGDVLEVYLEQVEDPTVVPGAGPEGIAVVILFA